MEKSQSCGVPESQESPAFEAKNHSTAFLRKAVRASEKKPGKRAAKKRG
jgi:hypothetical protein